MDEPTTPLVGLGPIKLAEAPTEYRHKSTIPSEAEIIESAITAVERVLTLPILERHKRDIINVMLWKLTEARGKYTTRYRSKASLHAPKDTPLQHEHVTTRKQLIDTIFQQPDNVRDIAATAIGCVVTKEEHERLTRITREEPQLQGWQRYEAAGIEVVDTDENP